MTGKDHEELPQQPAADAGVDRNRRATLSRLGLFAAVTPPVITLLLSAKARPAAAASGPAPGSSRQLKERVNVPQLRNAA
jgi:hypothetical protein